MRRTTGQIRERSPGSFELRYELGTNPATGRRRIATATVRGTRRDAEKELRRLLRLLDTGEHVDPNRFNVGEWLESWLGAIRREVAPRTAERYTEIADNFLAQHSAICNCQSSPRYTFKTPTMLGLPVVDATAKQAASRRGPGDISIVSSAPRSAAPSSSNSSPATHVTPSGSGYQRSSGAKWQH